MSRVKRLRVKPTDPYLENVDTVFLFGAGTSAHMKLSESDTAPCVPTDTNFFDVVQDESLRKWCQDAKILEIAQCARERVFGALRAAGILAEQQSGFLKVGLEELYCRLDMLRMLRRNITTPPKGARWKHPVEALRDLIAIVMAYGRSSNNDTGYTGFAKRILANHARKNANTYAVLSLNYEVGLESATKVRFEKDTSSFPETREKAKLYNLGSVGMHSLVHYALPNRQPPLSATEAIPILKLHGSCNWGFCPECSNAEHIPIELYSDRKNIPVEYLVGYANDRRACHWHSADKPLLPRYIPHIVPPTWNKWMGDYTLRYVWRQAYSVLNICKKLFIVGTSLPDTDIHLRHMIQMAFSGNEPKVYVVNHLDNKKSRDDYKKRVNAVLGSVPEENCLWKPFEDKEALDWIFERITDNAS